LYTEQDAANFGRQANTRAGGQSLKGEQETVIVQFATLKQSLQSEQDGGYCTVNEMEAVS
jgi:hypothetical protein